MYVCGVKSSKCSGTRCATVDAKTNMDPLRGGGGGGRRPSSKASTTAKTVATESNQQRLNLIAGALGGGAEQLQRRLARLDAG